MSYNDNKLLTSWIERWKWESFGKVKSEDLLSACITHQQIKNTLKKKKKKKNT